MTDRETPIRSTLTVACTRSECCNAPVVVGGEGMTHWYVCTACERPCDTTAMTDLESELGRKLESTEEDW